MSWCVCTQVRSTLSNIVKTKWTRRKGLTEWVEIVLSGVRKSVFTKINKLKEIETMGLATPRAGHQLVWRNEQTWRPSSQKKRFCPTSYEERPSWTHNTFIWHWRTAITAKWMHNSLATSNFQLRIDASVVSTEQRKWGPILPSFALC